MTGCGGTRNHPPGVGCSECLDGISRAAQRAINAIRETAEPIPDQAVTPAPLTEKKLVELLELAETEREYPLSVAGRRYRSDARIYLPRVIEALKEQMACSECQMLAGHSGTDVGLCFEHAEALAEEWLTLRDRAAEQAATIKQLTETTDFYDELEFCEDCAREIERRGDWPCAPESSPPKGAPMPPTLAALRSCLRQVLELEASIEAALMAVEAGMDPAELEAMDEEPEDDSE